MSKDEIIQDENDLLADYDTTSDLTTADAVSLFNSSLANALEKQMAEMLSELQKSVSVSTTVPTTTVASSVISNTNSNTSAKVSTSACQPSKFECKQEGTKIQYNFNSERISALRRIEVLSKSANVTEVVVLIPSEIETLNQRNIILKKADRHGWDTVHEYLDDPLADYNEDASKLRSAVFRASRKRTSNKPYSRGTGRGNFNPRALFRGFGQGYGQQRSDHYDDFSSQQSTQRAINDGLCLYCKRPNHTARFCTFKQRQASNSHSTTTVFLNKLSMV